MPGNRSIGAWKQVTSGKASPFTEDKTTTEWKLTTKAILNGWYLESSTDGGLTKTLHAIDPDGKSMRYWLFTQGNVVTLSGKIDEDGNAVQLSGTDQYGSRAEMTNKWIDNDHMEGTFIIKSKDGKILIDVSTKLSRIDE